MQTEHVGDDKKQLISLMFCFHLLCYAIICYSLVFLKFTYYAQKQELWLDHYAIYIPVWIKDSLYVAENFRKTVLL